MKVVVSVGGRFHAFNLAAELERQGYLKRLITSYPAFVAARYGVSPGNVASVPSKEILARAWHKMPVALRKRYDPDFLLAEYFDRRAAGLIPDGADLFVGWSYFSLHALRRAKTLGMVTVIDHGSAHIEYQRDILNEEYARFGLPSPMPDPRPVEKEKKEYAEADYIALPSQFAVRTFVEKGIPREKLLHVPYGVDLSAFKPSASPRNDGVFRVIYVGGMTLQKGVHYLLQAFAELDLPKTELLLVGGMHDEMQPFLKKYKKHVRAIGPVPQAELPEHYAQADAFVLNSVQDGFGMVIAQAMACGLPVIATENTGGPDVIRDGEDGFIIPIRDVEALKKKLKYLHDHPQARERMGASAAARVAEGFTWADYGRRMAAEYERILQKA